MSLASRTPIRIYPVIKDAVESYLRDYEEVFQYTSLESLIFGFRKAISSRRCAFFIIQAARKHGCVNMEVAVSSSSAYPYYRHREELSLGTFGFRENASLLAGEEELAFGYGVNTIKSTIGRIISTYAGPGIHSLLQATDAEIEMAHNIWDPLYEDWKKAETKVSFASLKKFPDLEFEEAAEEFITSNVVNGTMYDRFLGPMKRSYSDVKYFDCHVYLMASALEFLKYPPMPKKEEDAGESETEVSGKRMITWLDILGPEVKPEPAKKPGLNMGTEDRRPVWEDPIRYITGRQEQRECVALNDSDEHQRRLEYAFLKSASAMEGILNKERNPIVS